jgi:hypothetical protein
LRLQIKGRVEIQDQQDLPTQNRIKEKEALLVIKEDREIKV